MIQRFFRMLLGLPVVWVFNCHGQDAVAWSFAISPASGNKVIFSATAVLAPGWRLYSLHNSGGGSASTRFFYEVPPDWTVFGTMREQGNAITYYSDVYEMEMTYHTGRVDFEQEFSVQYPAGTLRGKVKYLACSQHACIPSVREFSVNLPRTQHPP